MQLLKKNTIFAYSKKYYFMNQHQERVAQVRAFFESKDTFLGFRRLLDVATDTQNMQIYEKCISLTDWKEKNPEKQDEFIEKSLNLLSEIEKFPVEVVPSDVFVLEAKNISKNYGVGKFSLHPMSLKIRKGEIYGLVGENGNGKTTLLRILAKELHESSGNLTYHFSQKPKNDYDLRTKLAYIPQRTKRWYGSLLNNLRFVLSNYGETPSEIETRVLMMVARLGLWSYKDLKWSELSSGYKMRFELARTLLRKPEILLLDEPLANLDVLAQQVILEDLKSIASSLNHPIALILSSQQLYEVEKISDKIIFLKNGKLQNLKSDENQPKPSLIVELDTSASREELASAFSEIEVKQITYNGGIYIVHFCSETLFSQVLFALGKSGLSITYIRDISTSTRRFFIN